MRNRIIAVLAASATLPLPAHSGLPEGDRLPDDAGQIRAPEFGVRCDGATDDTENLIRAIRSANSTDMLRGHHILQLPAGTCLISDTLQWAVGRTPEGRMRWQIQLELIGAGPDKTTLRVPDHHPHFQDPDNPRAVLFTASKQEPGDPADWSKDGSGNKAFHNGVRDLRIDCGAQNPGCVGIDFMASNRGWIRNVAIVSRQGSGYAGLRMERYAPGPLLVMNVDIRGFDHCIRVARNDYGPTFENIICLDPRVSGIRNSGNSLSIRSLRFSGDTAAIHNPLRTGHVVLIDSDLSSRSPVPSAVTGEGSVFARNTRTTGYSYLANEQVPGVEEYSSVPVRAAFENADALSSLRLPVRDTPETYWSADPTQWTAVDAFGAQGGDEQDDTTALQRALNECVRSGGTHGKIVYGSGRTYLARGEIRIPSCVRTLDFMNGVLRSLEGAPPLSFVVESGETPLTIQRAWIMNGALDSVPTVVHGSSRTLAIRDAYVGWLDTRTQSGPLFLEDVGINLSLRAGNQLWARQLNIEGQRPALLTNRGGIAWVLGMKTEGTSTIAHTSVSGCTEILGGLFYPVREFAPESTTPALDVSNAAAFLTGAETAYNRDSERRYYPTWVRETRAGTQKKLAPGTRSMAISANPSGCPRVTLGRSTQPEPRDLTAQP